MFRLYKHSNDYGWTLVNLTTNKNWICSDIKYLFWVMPLLKRNIGNINSQFDNTYIHICDFETIEDLQNRYPELFV